MKVCIPTSVSGHLTEILYLMEAFEGCDVFFVSTDNPRTRDLSSRYRTYFFPVEVETKPIALLKSVPHMIRIIRLERPQVMFSTGAQFTILFLYLGKFFGAKIIFLEDLTRVHTPTWTGRLVYPISDLFLVQHPSLLEKYGKKAEYEGGIL